ATPSEVARELLAIAAAAIATHAQQQPPSAQQPEAQIAVRVELVNLDVTVTDARGNYVRNLKRENFRVLDESQPQIITHFTPMEAPAQVLLVVETGPAVYLIHRQHLAAAHLLLQGLGAEDAVALATYDSQARIVQSFTTGKRALQAQIAGLTYNLGPSQLNFYGSLAAALDWLAATPGKKSVVLLTTGLDDSPAARWEALLGKLRASEAAVYTVALGGELREPPAAKKGVPADPEALQVAERFAHADRALKEIADITGGQAFFPRKPSDFDSIYRQIATVLRHTYRIGFAPPKRDGQYHRVFVQLLDDQGEVLGPFYAEWNTEEEQQGNAKRKRGRFPKRVRYRLHTRRGYMAPLESGS
ncbi:MAG: VWA domain-containing protein, partial [Candidatus Acidiferrales bacterium]